MQTYQTLQKLGRSGASVYTRHNVVKRHTATSFAELYRQSVESAPVKPGDTVTGHIVGRRQPRSSLSRFYIVDFGLKSEAPFAAKEIPGTSAIGDEVAMPLLALEDDFNEPVLDFEKRVELPSLQAERYSLLTKVGRNETRLVHGRFAAFKKGGASVKVLGTHAFAPRHHVVAVDRPIVGSYAPFYLLSMSAEKRTRGTGLDVNPVVSSYGGFLFCLANLVGRDDIWGKNNRQSNKERLSYLQLLTRLLVMKNSAIRRMLPKNVDYQRRRGDRRRDNSVGEKKDPMQDTAWLNDLPRGDWASSGMSKERDGARAVDAAKAWDRMRQPFSRTLQKANDNVSSRPLIRSQRKSKVDRSGFPKSEVKPDDDA